MLPPPSSERGLGATLARWRDSALFRFAASSVLVLVLQIPVGLISHTIDERRERRAEAIAEVTRTWGGQQELVGPVLTIPFTRRWVDADKVTHESVILHRVLPRELSITGRARIETRRRGIFEVPLYVADVHVEGTLVLPDDAAARTAGLAAGDVPHWDRAELALGLSDVGAIRAASSLKIGDASRVLEPGPGAAGFLQAGLHAAIPQVSPGATIPFSVDVTFGGHGRLSFVPAGDQTRVELTSPWPHPSFDGAVLPTERRVAPSGFTARWHRLHLGRNFPSAWTNEDVAQAQLSATAFGVTLLAPFDTYRSNDRAVKYQLLFIGLTFLAFTLVELLAAMRVHPIQYLLVGFALCLFFLLLLSLSEHVGFARAYVAAAVATIALIGGYVRVVFGDLRRGLAIGGLLAALYAFLFVLLQIEEYALLVGSIGLFFVLAVVMTLTRRVNWYDPAPARNR
jgi:inner membrane protein